MDKLGRKFSSLTTAMMYYDSKVRNDFDEHIEVVKIVLKAHNPDWNSDNFKLDQKENKLTLSGKCKHLNIRWGKEFKYASLIKTLNIKHLDLRNAETVSPHHLQGLDLEILDIRGHKITRLFNKSTAKKIILTKSKISERNLKILKKRFEVVVED